jgi:AcrR family transcriptional regulator
MAPVSESDVRQRILRAALELFAERGFATTTTAAIAQRANVAEKTLFAQFKSKSLLFDQTLSPAVLELAAPELVTSLLDTVGQSWGQLDELMRAVLHNRVEFARHHQDKLKLIVQEVLLRPERVSRFVAHGKRDVMPRFEKVVARLIADGELRDIPTPTVLRLLVSVAVGYLVIRFILLPELAWDDEREIDLMVSAISDGLRPRDKRSTQAKKPRTPTSTASKTRRTASAAPAKKRSAVAAARAKSDRSR